MNSKYLAVAAALACATVASADVVYDEYGVGFVGKGDVQSLYDWNNSMLQDNAHLVSFRMLVSGSAAWKCQGVNPGGQTVTFTESYESSDVAADVNFDARKNRAGQVTGFILNGVDGGAQYTNVGECPSRNPNWQQQPVLVADSIVYTGSDEPLLQISIDAGDWYDLPMTD